MGVGRVTYGSGVSEDTDRGRSPFLWKGSHFEEIVAGNNTLGLHWGDDFQDGVATGVKYTLVETDDNAAWAPVTTVGDGRLALTLATDDNEEGNIIYSIDSSIIGDITENSGIETFFEARFKVSSVSDDDIAVYVGLAEAGMTGANMQTDDTGVLSAKDYIMFRTLHVNGGATGANAALDVAYNTNGGTEVEKVSAIDTLVADTFVKVGIHHDGKSTVKYFVNGVPSTTTSDPSDATFPDGEELTFAAGAKMGDSAGGVLTLDWWHVIRLDRWANA